MVDEEGGMRENNEDGRGGRNKVEQQSVRERESTATTDEEGGKGKGVHKEARAPGHSGPPPPSSFSLRARRRTGRRVEDRESVV